MQYQREMAALKNGRKSGESDNGAITRGRDGIKDQ